ncbi:MAG: DUF3263 domain-containing protein [Mycolicibacterium neoaurum]|uniref:DUF3263 domain-containing protein n=1 Tax=Mycolicibacterium neoaurum TaxID=1795 RepID=UPI002FFC3BAB
MALDSLNDQERAILDFEAGWWATAGGKEDEIRNQFGISPTRYYQQLVKLVTRRAALDYDPITANRLVRVTAQKTGMSSYR